MSDEVYPIPILLDMLRKPCGLKNCRHCEIERQAAREIERLQKQYMELAAAVWVQTREEFEADQIPHSETLQEAADGARALVMEKVRGQ
jgi:hypothetical protein